MKASASLRAAYKNGAASTFIPCTYVPGSLAPASEPSVVKVKALALDFMVGVAFCSSGLPCSVIEYDSRGGCFSSFASCNFHATALRRRIKDASLTRRRKSGSVARVRKVSLRILEYAGEAPRWMRARYASVSRTGALSNINQTYIRMDDYSVINTMCSSLRGGDLPCHPNHFLYPGPESSVS